MSRNAKESREQKCKIKSWKRKHKRENQFSLSLSYRHLPAYILILALIDTSYKVGHTG